MKPANKFRTCDVCGQRYQYVNWMVRRGIRDNNGRWLKDTHEIACAKKAGLYDGQTNASTRERYG